MLVHTNFWIKNKDIDGENELWVFFLFSYFYKEKI